MSINDFATKDPAAELNWEFNFSAELPASTTVTAINTTVPAGLTEELETPDLANARTVVRISGGTHGQLYDVRSVATLSNGEELVGTLTLRVFRGA
jgi:hypothetical protein